MSKGSQPRPYNPAAFDSGWDRIFAGPAKAAEYAKAGVSAKPTDNLAGFKHAFDRDRATRVVSMLVNHVRNVSVKYPDTVTDRGMEAMRQANELLSDFSVFRTIPLDPAPGSP